MIFAPLLRRFGLLGLAAALTPLRLALAQASAPTSADAVAAPIVVKGSSTQISADQFLAGFIATAARLRGGKFIASVTAAVQMRPDLAAKVVTCALNIARLNSHSTNGQIPLPVIDQIVKAAVSAAPQNAVEIVKAAVKSEPYARASIVVAAISAAPDEAAEIQIAATGTSSTSMLASLVIPATNPVNNGG